MIKASRDLGRLTKTFTPKRYHQRLGCLLIAFSIAFKQHIQGERINEELAPYLDSEEELEHVQKLKGRPFYILYLLHSLFYKAINEQYADSAVKAVAYEASVEHCLHVLGNAATACERIVKQPVPLAYTRHTSRFLSLYLFSLPLALISSLGWYSVITMLFVSWSFVSIKGALIALLCLLHIQ